MTKAKRPLQVMELFQIYDSKCDTYIGTKVAEILESSLILED